MIAALRSEFGPLPDQSMHEKTSVPALIEELYTFLRQADSRELNDHLPRARRRPQGRRQGEGSRADREDRQFPDPRRADHRRHRRRLRQCRGDLSAGQEDDRGRRLRAADREPGVRREAVRPPGRQGHGAARGLPGQDPRLPPRLPRTRRRRRHHRHPHRLARRRPDPADRRQPPAGRHRRPVQQLPGLRGSRCHQGRQRRRHHQPQRQAAASEASAQQPVPVPRRHRCGSLRARLHHLAAERRRPAVDRDREAAHRADRLDGRPHPRSHAERQAGLQQLAVVQLDAQLPLAGL